MTDTPTLQETLEEITDRFLEALRACEERGMKLPFVVCAISPNGSVERPLIVTAISPNGFSYTRLDVDDARLDRLALVLHRDLEGFPTPMLVVADQTGKAVGVTVEAERLAFH
jgi:hypothetical protein